MSSFWQSVSYTIILQSQLKLAYGRARHYIGKKEGKPQFEYHPQSIESLKTLLKAQSISLTTEKV